RAEDADIAADIAVRSVEYRRGNGLAETGLPQHSHQRGSIRIEGKDAVFHSRNEEDVARTDSGNRQATDVERLGIHLAIDRKGGELTEISGGNCCGRKQDFL